MGDLLFAKTTKKVIVKNPKRWRITIESAIMAWALHGRRGTKKLEVMIK